MKNSEFIGAEYYHKLKGKTSLVSYIVTLEAIIMWALGEQGNFPPRKTGKGSYWWRTEMRKRLMSAKKAYSKNCSEINDDIR